MATRWIAWIHLDSDENGPYVALRSCRGNKPDYETFDEQKTADVDDFIKWLDTYMVDGYDLSFIRPEEIVRAVAHLERIKVSSE